MSISVFRKPDRHYLSIAINDYPFPYEWVIVPKTEFLLIEALLLCCIRI